MTAPVSIEEIIKARERIRHTLPITPITYSPTVSELAKRDVYFKWENKLKTGSFKERGALNYLTYLHEKQLVGNGVCSASMGNHALGVSYHASRLKVPCTIVMPTTAPLIKVQASREYGSEVILHGLNLSEAYAQATTIAASRGLTFVPPYDHPLVIAGQGTAGLENA